MSYKKTFLLGGDLELNRMGFGAMRITGPEVYGMPEDSQHSIDVLQRAVQLGVNFIDTADAYGEFVSEELIAKALHPYDEDLVIGTKGGLVRFGPLYDLKLDGTPQHLHDALNGSLDRLKLDQITLYQLHRIDPDVPAEISFAFLQQAQEEGRIKHIGLSEVSVEQIRQAEKYFDVASVQNQYNIFNREHEPVLEYCKEKNIAFIPFSPIGGGEMEEEAALQDIANPKEATTRQIALSWLLHHADNILPIPGTSNINHLEQNMQAADIELTEEDVKRLDASNG